MKKLELSYIGVTAPTPPNLTKEKRAPLATDYTSYNLGDLWLYKDNKVYMLISKSGKTSTWQELGAGDVQNIVITCDIGTMTSTDGAFTITGEHPMGIVASGTTITIGLLNGSDGQLLIGGGSAATWGNITSTGASITITNTPNGINLEASGVAGLTQLDTDSGSALPVAGIINILGSDNIATSASGNNLTVSFNGILDVPHGGIGIGSLTQNGILLGNGTSAVTATSEMNSGQVLIGRDTLPPIPAFITPGAGININYGSGSIEIVNTGVDGEPATWYEYGTTTKDYRVVLFDGINKIIRAGTSNDLYISSTYMKKGWQYEPPIDGAPNITSLCCGYDSMGGANSGNNIYVCGNNGKIAWQTSNSYSWNDGTTTVSPLKYLNAIELFGGTLLTGGEGGYLFKYSRPSTLFTVISTDLFGSGDDINDIKIDSYFGYLWIAVGNNGQLATSTSPTTSWTNRTSSFGTTNIKKVAYGEGYWVAVGENNKMAYSTDGLNWSTKAGPFSASTNINSIAFGEGSWVIVGDSGKLATSSNPTGTWHVRTVPTIQNLYDVTYIDLKGMWMVVGNNITLISY